MDQITALKWAVGLNVGLNVGAPLLIDQDLVQRVKAGGPYTDEEQAIVLALGATSLALTAATFFLVFAPKGWLKGVGVKPA